MGYIITKMFTEDPISCLTKDLQQSTLPTVKAVRETYCNSGIYFRRGSALVLGTEDSGECWWCIGSPRSGRFQYKVTPLDNSQIRVHLTDRIFFDTSTLSLNGMTYYWSKDDVWVESIEDLILSFYMNNDNVLSKDKGMTYASGCRQYKDELVHLL